MGHLKDIVAGHQKREKIATLNIRLCFFQSAVRRVAQFDGGVRHNAISRVYHCAREAASCRGLSREGFRQESYEQQGDDRRALASVFHSLATKCEKKSDAAGTIQQLQPLGNHRESNGTIPVRFCEAGFTIPFVLYLQRTPQGLLTSNRLTYVSLIPALSVNCATCPTALCWCNFGTIGTTEPSFEEGRTNL